MTTLTDLAGWLANEPAGDEVKAVVTVIAGACARISKVVASGAISGSLGAAGQVNVQDEEQKKLDIITNDILRDALNGCALVAGLASEELEVIETTGAVGGFLVTFDPLDGSSNIDVNVSVGTIFSILPAPAGVGADRGRLPAAGPPAGRRRLRRLRSADHAGADAVEGRGRLHAGRRRDLAADAPDHRHPGRHRRVRDQHVQPAPLGRAGAPLCRRLPAGQDAAPGQELQHALGRLDGGRRPPHPDARRHLHVPVGRPRARQAGQAAPAVRGQPDVADRRTRGW